MPVRATIIALGAFLALGSVGCGVSDRESDATAVASGFTPRSSSGMARPHVPS